MKVTTHKAAALATFAIALALTACAAAPMPVPTVTASPIAAPTGDGVLRIGTLLPDKGPDAALAQAEVASVELAVAEINAAGGVNGTPVELFHRNSGDPASTTPELALSELIDKGVDVIIGPASADLIDRLAPAATAANVVLISPSALDAELPAGNLVYRLAGSAATQAAALAGAIRQSGATHIAYVHSADDDAFGTELARAVTGAGQPRALAYYPAFGSIDLDLPVGADAASIAQQVAAASPDAVVLSIADTAVAASVISALSTAGVAGTSIWLASADTVSYDKGVPKGALEGATGVLVGARPDAAFAARIRQSDPAVRRFDFAAEAYDATILAALAAVTSNDDGGSSVAAALPAVTHGGIPCTSFGECIFVLNDRSNINYNGVSGVDLGGNGLPAGAAFSLYSYDVAGEMSLLRVVTTD